MGQRLPVFQGFQAMIGTRPIADQMLPLRYAEGSAPAPDIPALTMLELAPNSILVRRDATDVGVDSK